MEELKKFMAAIPVPFRNDLVSDSELYQRETDPDTETMIALNKRADEYQKAAQETARQIAELTPQIQRLAQEAKTHQENRNATKIREAQAKALPLMRRKQKLEAEAVRIQQRRDNFELLAESLKKQKREKDDDRLLREANVRLAVGQQSLDRSEHDRAVKEARRLNQNVEKMGGLFDSPLELGVSMQSDEALLAQFSTMDMGDFDLLTPQQQQQQPQSTHQQQRVLRSTLDNEY